MIFVDTNYFIRYFLQDIQAQYKTARTLFKQAAAGQCRLLISTLVIFEINWVLASSYRFNRAAVAEVLSQVLRLKSRTDCAN